MTIPPILHTLLTGAVLGLALAGAVFIVHTARRAWRNRARRDVEGWDYGDWPNGPGL